MSRSAVRVRSSALYLVPICRENSGARRGSGVNSQTNLPQPAEEASLVEWRRDDSANRFDGRASWLGKRPPRCSRTMERAPQISWSGTRSAIGARCRPVTPARTRFRSAAAGPGKGRHRYPHVNGRRRTRPSREQVLPDHGSPAQFSNSPGIRTSSVASTDES
jgi:hypothetical protein